MNWLQPFRSALHEEFDNHPMVAVLATVSPDGKAAGRCVILREVTDDGRLLFTTDARSVKVSQLAANPSAECVFWLVTLRRQYRVSGRASIESDPATRSRVWGDLSLATRATFFGPPPGKPVDPAHTPTPLHHQWGEPESFLVLSLVTDRVESLDLTTHPYTRIEWAGKDDWQRHAINP